MKIKWLLCVLTSEIHTLYFGCLGKYVTMTGGAYFDVQW